MASFDVPPLPEPGYIIYRDVAPGEPYDPMTPPTFFPPKDSDELFDALRVKYPHVKSHSERMRDAIIEFLIEERDTEQLTQILSPTMTTEMTIPAMTESSDLSPWQHSWPSASMSTLSSPETMGLATPTFGNSPQPHVPHLARETSSMTSMSVSSETTPATPQMENMTGVFSLSSTAQPKQRIRRKMTEAEKIE